ncbi:MAG: aminoacyl-tRNA hydrolase [Clostridia bacterium]|nr:aminoacyl-tRNA hydrolase [Clostridia bacterium]
MFRRKKVSEPASVDYIVCGLGNPGSKYETTRHNVGFIAVDLLAEKAGLGRLSKTKCKAVYGTGTIAGKSVLLMKPQTYMNLSGEAVRDMMQAFSVPADRLIVIFDDADLAPGRIRIRKNGSAGTHNGMRNIVYLLENDKFPRVKVGIGKPDKERGEDMADFVLSPMDSDTYAACKAVPDLICDLLENGIDHAMQEFNNFQPTK